MIATYEKEVKVDSIVIKPLGLLVISKKHTGE